MTNAQTVPYEPPSIEQRTALDGPLIGLGSGEVVPSAAFRPI
jgi:hypothetical protein